MSVRYIVIVWKIFVCENYSMTLYYQQDILSGENQYHLPDSGT
jgi:hypothetical protein